MTLYTPLQARQLQFERNGLSYHYIWSDRQHNRHQTDFQIQQYPRELTYFSAYEPKRANQFILQGLRLFTQKQDPKQARIQLNAQGNQYSWTIQAQTPEAIQQLNKQLETIKDQRWNDYLKTHHFRIGKDPSGRAGIMPDHVQIALQSAPYLKNVAEQFFKAGQPVQQQTTAIEQVMAFIQNIPYNTLQNRDNYRGAGFMTPIQVLRNNMGDCDSKATLLAAILKAAWPDLETAMVYIPEHAFLAIHLPPKASQKSVTINQQQWVVADPTGPALLALGTLASQSEHAVHSGYYHTLIIR
ncbi:hypothetical protein [Celerinatantimonas sp. YJH-8]|uniref:hypothetical protein n=1 Tax=Celerinatantimonas sp. YJH-8 TaxID=3228714 RepID=UPI0038C168BE